MKKLIFLLSVLLMILSGCDNNSGPFQIKIENRRKVLYSDNKPAKGWVENTIYDYNDNSVKVYEIYFDKGIPNGDFKLYNVYGELVVDAKGKWEDGYFVGKIKEPKMNVVAKGKFSINTNYLIDYEGNGYKDFSFETLRDGTYDGDDYKYTLVNGKYDGTYLKYHLDGTRKVETEKEYQNGLNTKLVRYNYDGSIFRDITYRGPDDFIRVYSAYPDGTPQSEYYYSDTDKKYTIVREFTSKDKNTLLISERITRNGQTVFSKKPFEITKNKAVDYVKKNKIEKLMDEYSSDK